MNKGAAQVEAAILVVSAQGRMRCAGHARRQLARRVGARSTWCGDDKADAADGPESCFDCGVEVRELLSGYG